MNFEETLRIVVKMIGTEKAEAKLKNFGVFTGKQMSAARVLEKRNNDALAASIQDRYKKEADLQKKVEAKRKATNKRRIANDKKRLQLSRQLEVKGVNNFAGMNLKQMDKLNHKLNIMGKSARKFKMHWLGIMFAGMAVDRVMSKLIRGMIKDYKELTKSAMTPLSESLTRLEANWKFLKFSIVEASGAWLTGLVNNISGFVSWLSKQNPKVLMGIAMGIGAIAVTAKAFMIGGQVMLGLTSFSAWMADLKLKKVTDAANATGKLSKNVSKLSKLDMAIGLAVTISTISMFSDDGTSFGQRAFTTAGFAYLGARIGSFIAPGLGTGIGAAIGVVTGLVVNLADIKIEKMNHASFMKARTSFQDWLNQVSKATILDDNDFTLQLQKKFVEVLSGDKMSNLRGTLVPAFNELSFEVSKGIIDEETFRNSVAALLKTRIPEMSVAGNVLKEDLITPSLDAAKELIETISEKGGEAFTVELTDSVGAFLNDEDSGMAALQSAAEKYNRTLSETVNKTVNIMFTGDNGTQSVNPFTYS